MAYAIKLAPYVLKQFKRLDGDVRRSVTSALESLGRPEFATHPGHALDGDLSAVRRVRRGRLRIFYIASDARETVIVLFIGLRREGERDDAYKAFRALLDNGDFEPQFEELGIAL